VDDLQCDESEFDIGVDLAGLWHSSGLCGRYHLFLAESVTGISVRMSWRGIWIERMFCLFYFCRNTGHVNQHIRNGRHF